MRLKIPQNFAIPLTTKRRWVCLRSYPQNQKPTTRWRQYRWRWSDGVRMERQPTKSRSTLRSEGVSWVTYVHTQQSSSNVEDNVAGELVMQTYKVVVAMKETTAWSFASESSRQRHAFLFGRHHATACTRGGSGYEPGYSQIPQWYHLDANSVAHSWADARAQQMWYPREKNICKGIPWLFLATRSPLSPLQRVAALRARCFDSSPKLCASLDRTHFVQLESISCLLSSFGRSFHSSTSMATRTALVRRRKDMLQKWCRRDSGIRLQHIPNRQDLWSHCIPHKQDIPSLRNHNNSCWWLREISG